MNTILTYTFLLSLPVLFHSAGYEKSQTPRAVHQYCNSEYNYCVKYPESLLPLKEEFTDGTGIRLKTKDQLSDVSVRAIPSQPGKTPKALFEAALEKFSGEITVISSSFGDDYYEAQFLDVTGGANYLYRVDYLPNHYIRLVARVPAGRPWLIERLKEDVVVQFDK